MARNARLIYNPEAGTLRRHGRGMLDKAVEQLRQTGIPVELVATTGPGTGGAIARELVQRQRVDTVIVAGGDGTINEVMNGLVHTDVAFGVLPAGTANVLANEMQIGSWRKALAALPQSRAVRIPVGKVVTESQGERYFLMMAGAGFDARMVHTVNHGLKRRLGKVAYWVAGLSQLGRNLEQLQVVANGSTYQASLCLASRVRNYGGDLNIAPSIRITDDDLEVILFEGKFTATYLAHLFSILSGRVEAADRITVLRSRRIEMRSASGEPVHLHVDGEYVGLLPATVAVEPDALNLLTPPGYLQDTRGRAA
ncbi:MAG: diacylglycerol kinase family lipid kinase [Bryobacterales bacterium]|nr:diacylglycerol kinase family lipid kinase [Bryobacterales bacterium]